MFWYLPAELYSSEQRQNWHIQKQLQLIHRFLSGEVYSAFASLWDIISNYLFQDIIFFDLKHERSFKQKSSELISFSHFTKHKIQVFNQICSLFWNTGYQH